MLSFFIEGPVATRRNALCRDIRRNAAAHWRMEAHCCDLVYGGTFMWSGVWRHFPLASCMQTADILLMDCEVLDTHFWWFRYAPRFLYVSTFQSARSYLDKFMLINATGFLYLSIGLWWTSKNPQRTPMNLHENACYSLWFYMKPIIQNRLRFPLIVVTFRQRLFFII